MDPDQAWIRRLRAGDTGALEAAFRLHGARVFRVARRVLRNPSDAEEVLQEVFLKLAQRIDQLRDPAGFRTWLHATTVRTALHRREREDLRWSEPLEADAQAAGPAASPVNGAIAAEDRRRLAAWIDRLPLEQRLVLHLREVEGASYAEIAATLEIPPGTVMSRLARAREKLIEMARPAEGTSPTPAARTTNP